MFKSYFFALILVVGLQSLHAYASEEKTVKGVTCNLFEYYDRTGSDSLLYGPLVLNSDTRSRSPFGMPYLFDGIEGRLFIDANLTEVSQDRYILSYILKQVIYTDVTGNPMVGGNVTTTQKILLKLEKPVSLEKNKNTADFFTIESQDNGRPSNNPGGLKLNCLVD
jgi:hypothetical protein